MYALSRGGGQDTLIAYARLKKGQVESSVGCLRQVEGAL